MSENVELTENKLLDSKSILEIIHWLENTAGYVFPVIGQKRDFEEAVAFFKKAIAENQDLSDIQKTACLASAHRIIKEQMNIQQVIDSALSKLNQKACVKNISEDWLNYFFDYAKNVEDKTIREIWARILAEKCNGNTSIRRNLIHILSLMDTETAYAFTNLCSVSVSIPKTNLISSLKMQYIPRRVPFVLPAISIALLALLPDFSLEKKASENYNHFLPSAQQISILEELGLIRIEPNIEKGFEYPIDIGMTEHIFDGDNKFKRTVSHLYIIEYFGKKYAVEKTSDSKLFADENHDKNDSKSIRLGYVMFTSIGEALYNLIDTEPVEGLEHILAYHLKNQGYSINYVESEE